MSKRYNLKSINEAVNIPSATHIGTRKGYDVFDILTYEAASGFQTTDNRNAAEVYIHDQETFNRHISETQKLYFFTLENTNEVVAGLICGSRISNNHISIKNSITDVIITDLHSNFLFETASTENLIQDNNLPLSLVPNLRIREVEGYGMCVKDNTLLACLGQFNENDSLLQYMVPQDITSVATDAFTWGVELLTLITRTNTLPTGLTSLDNVSNIIYTDEGNEEQPALEDTTEASPEISSEVQNEENEIKDPSPKEVKKDLTDKDEESDPNQAEINKLIYRIVGDEVIIVKGKPQYHYITIPETIQGKTVTTIGPYAFFNNTAIEQLNLPETIKKIGKGAFYGARNLDIFSKRALNWLKDKKSVTIEKDALLYDHN